jgi:hypothetical protein
MYALSRAADSYSLCGDYAAAHAQLDELIPLADERGKALETAVRGWLFASTGNASDAVRQSPRGSRHFGQLEQLFMNRGIFGIWQWLMQNLASLTMLGVAFTTR